MIVGRPVSAVVAGVYELVVAQFLHWWHFFAAFLEIPVMVSIITEKGNVMLDIHK